MTIVALAFVASGASSLLAGCGGGSTGGAGHRSSATTTTTSATAAAGVGTTSTTTVDPGSLPQTSARPSASDPAFLADVHTLFQAIVADTPATARPFFFPLGAYRQVKAISDPEHDYATRLIANYETDIHHLHRVLPLGPGTPDFVSITVPASSTRWIVPGVEYNKGSYWRVLHSTITYRVNGTTHTFDVASLISWRGRWYIVHLGPIR